jgi:hypothetical protein
MQPTYRNADAGRDSMNLDREQKVTDITREIRQGEYRVDPGLVADAIVRRLGLVATLRAEPGQIDSAGRVAATAGAVPIVQNEC